MEDPITTSARKLSTSALNEYLYVYSLVRWSVDWDIASFPASPSCVKITPDLSGSYTHDDPLPEGRSMANLVFLPDGRILCLNGARTGSILVRFTAPFSYYIDSRNGWLWEPVLGYRRVVR